MAEISLAYGHHSVILNLPSRHLTSILRPRESRQTITGAALVEQELNTAIDGPSGLPLKKTKTLFLLPDKTRNCGAPVLLPILLEKLNYIGVHDSDITLLIANGSHAPNTDAEIREMFGPRITQRVGIIQHDCHDGDELGYLGVTSSDVPVFLNRRLIESEQVLVAGTAVHHYFAGFGGGAKMLNPGCAGYETITKNHALTISLEDRGLHPGCQAGVLEGNPVQNDIRESIQTLLPVFLVETVMNGLGEIDRVFAGSLFPTHQAACNYVNDLYKISVEEPADLVIASCGGFPKDINLIQAHKTIHNAFQVVKPGGVLLVLAECSQGVGSDTFMQWFDCGDYDLMLRTLTERYTLNGTTALSLQSKTRAVKIILVSDLDGTIATRCGIEKATTLEAGFASAQRLLPGNYSCLVIPNGSVTLPVLV